VTEAGPKPPKLFRGAIPMPEPGLRLIPLNAVKDPGSAGLALPRPEGRLLRLFFVRHGALLRAFVDDCPHSRVPLDGGIKDWLTHDRSAILCRIHGAQFDLERGVCFMGPCPGRALLEVPVTLSDGWITAAEA